MRLDLRVVRLLGQTESHKFGVPHSDGYFSGLDIFTASIKRAEVRRVVIFCRDTQKRHRKKRKLQIEELRVENLYRTGPNTFVNLAP